MEKDIGKIKKNGIIHFYDFLHEKDMPDKAWNKVKKVCVFQKRKPKLVNWVKCGQQSPHVYRVCLDVKVD